MTQYITKRLFCALLSLPINHMDVDYAYVNADLEDNVEIWCCPPFGMNIPRGKYIRHNKTLYGLKQADRQWNMDNNTYILAIGFIRLDIRVTASEH